MKRCFELSSELLVCSIVQRNHSTKVQQSCTYKGKKHFTVYPYMIVQFHVPSLNVLEVEVMYKEDERE